MPKNQAKVPVPSEFPTPDYPYLKKMLANAIVTKDFPIEAATKHIENTLSVFDLKVIYSIIDVKPYFQGQEVSIISCGPKGRKPSYLGIIPEQNIPWVDSDPTYHSFHIMHIPKDTTMSSLEEYINEKNDLNEGIYIETVETSEYNILLVMPTEKQFLLNNNKHILTSFGYVTYNKLNPKHANRGFYFSDIHRPGNYELKGYSSGPAITNRDELGVVNITEGVIYSYLKERGKTPKYNGKFLKVDYDSSN